MVLLSSDNQLNIKKYHILQCLEKKRESFNVIVIPLDKTLDKTLDKNDNKNLNISDKDIESILSSNKKK